MARCRSCGVVGSPVIPDILYTTESATCPRGVMACTVVGITSGCWERWDCWEWWECLSLSEERAVGPAEGPACGGEVDAAASTDWRRAAVELAWRYAGTESDLLVEAVGAPDLLPPAPVPGCD